MLSHYRMQLPWWARRKPMTFHDWSVVYIYIFIYYPYVFRLILFGVMECNGYIYIYYPSNVDHMNGTMSFRFGHQGTSQVFVGVFSTSACWCFARKEPHANHWNRNAAARKRWSNVLELRRFFWIEDMQLSSNGGTLRSSTYRNHPFKALRGTSIYGNPHI